MVIKMATVTKEASQLGNFSFLNHALIGYRTMAKEIPSINIIQKGLKMKKVKINVADNKLIKKYFSIDFACMVLL